MQLTKGKSYQAQLKMKSFMHIVAPNKKVAEHFEEKYPFINVVSSGAGADRVVTGTWNGDSQEVELNDERIVSVREI